MPGHASAAHSAASNELGGAESGFTAQLFGPWLGHTLATGAILSVALGGVGTVLVVLAVAWVWPEIRRYGKLA